jgi:integrase
MARHRLTEAKIRTLHEPGVHGDGDGLFLRVREGGSKQFVFIYRRGKKRTEIGLGGYGQGTAPVSLALARKKAEEIRGQLSRGEDPRPGKTAKPTFRKVMESTIAVKHADFRNEKHKAQWRMTLDKYAAPLHEIPVADITVDNIVTALEPVWQRIPETVDRLRMRIEAVLDHAKARGLRQGDNPAAWKGNLKHLLPSRQKLTRGHHAALGYKDVPAMISRLRGAKGVSALAVEFVTLTLGRSGEARFGAWPEINFQEKLWTIPAGRMKAGKEHRVPLADRAMEILKIMKQRATSELIFGGERDGRPISDVAMTKALRRASGDNSTLHGLRSSFRDWCGDSTTHPRDIVETALAHAIENKTEAAYRRGDALDKRRKLMEEWADYCGSAC